MPIGSIAAGLIGSQGAQQAGAAAGAAGQQAMTNANNEIGDIRSSVSPWTSTGTAAAGRLASLYGFGHLVSGTGWGGVNLVPDQNGQDQAAAQSQFFTSPGYDFRLQQGINALDRSASSRGMLLSGAQQKGVNDYAQGQASSEYGNYINQLNAMSGQGAGAAAGANSTAGNVFNAGNQDQFQGAMGRANSYQNSANALASGISSGVNNLAAISAYGLGGGFGGLGGPTGANAGGMAGNPMTTALSGY